LGGAARAGKRRRRDETVWRNACSGDVPMRDVDTGLVDLVYHVLAHVQGSAHLPASVYDATYVAWAQRHLGPASRRNLGRDLELLARSLSTHESLAAAQLLAFLFADVAQLQRAEACDLALLEEHHMSAPSLRPAVLSAGVGAELLRAACELELAAHLTLPPVSLEIGSFSRAIEAQHAVAPWLRRSAVVPVRSLRLRGRVVRSVIWVGAPESCDGPSLEHVAWQASHEATVMEVSTHFAHRLDHDVLEHTAIVLLARRAERAARAHAHRQWLSHLDGGVGFLDRPLDARVVGELDAMLA
jgi:hypothetical protein